MVLLEFCAAVVATYAIVKKSKKSKQQEQQQQQQQGPYGQYPQGPAGYYQQPPPHPTSPYPQPPRKYGRNRENEFRDEPPPYTMEAPSQPGPVNYDQNHHAPPYNDQAYAGSRSVEPKTRRGFDGRQR